MTLAEFWAATVTETLMVIQAFAWRNGEQIRADLYHAWHTAALAGANFSKSGMPALRTVVPPRKVADPVPMTPEQEAAHWERWASQYPQPERAA
jgi:hypothetical protein